MILLKKGHVFSPEYVGIRDVMIAGKEIVAIGDNLNPDGLPVTCIDCTGKNIFPGFIDGHVHIAGGGGEGSFKTRTPEIMLTDITQAGVTTVVGCLGTDGTTRSMSNLLAKAYALEEEGITTYVYSGSYKVPVKTLTNSIQDDIILIEKVIGTGEIAISDHRSSVPTTEELCKVASQSRVGGMLSGKAGIVNIHLGDGQEGLKPLYDVSNNSEIPLTQFLPTHINRNRSLYLEGLDFAKEGGYIDFTTSTTKQFIEMGEVASPKALSEALETGVPITQMTFTSDGQGSLPEFDEDNNLRGLTIGRLSSLYDAVVQAVKEEEVPMEDAIRVITSNPADILKLQKKGRVQVGHDGDIVIVDGETLEIETVIAKGQLMILENEVLKKGTFE